jgi:L-2-hydroxyglutarate oxidase LhgO
VHLTETYHLDCAVIGAGVVGLAIARVLAHAGREVVVVEAEETIGTGISSRNSEVIHAGIYYPAGSRKARTCVAGKQALYAFCESHGVPHAHCGKLIVATDEDEEASLADTIAKAAANGVEDLRWLTAAEAQVLEPELACTAALLSPSTGIVDSHGLMLALEGEAEDHGAAVALAAPMLSGRATDEGRIRIEVGGASPARLDCALVVNAGGLGAPALARSIEGLDPARVPGDHICKGSYFIFSGQPPFRRLIYPVAHASGWLGLHLTIDLGGQTRFGPDMEWPVEIDFDVDPARAEIFYQAVRRYWPGLPDGALLPGYAGYRPKIHGPGEPAADFMVEGPAEHGLPGLINLFGIESPGLTAALALADEVGEIARETR